MIKKMKAKKEFTFRELMEWIIENDVSGYFKCLDGKHEFSVSGNGTFYFNAYHYGDGETYEVEVEEEITEDMEFRVLIEIFSKTHTITHNFKSVKEIKDDGTEKIYALIDGELQKVWQRCEENDR